MPPKKKRKLSVERALALVPKDEPSHSMEDEEDQRETEEQWGWRHNDRIRQAAANLESLQRRGFLTAPRYLLPRRRDGTIPFGNDSVSGNPDDCRPTLL